MGEGENKAEEKKMEEKKAGEEKKEETKAEKVSEEKKEEKKAEETKDAAAAPPPPPPPQEIVLKVYMHCEGCAKKVRRCLKGFEGVEEVQTDCKAHKVVVKGEKADPVKVLERVQKKSHRQVELISPIPKPPPPPAEDEKKTEEKEVAKPEEKKEVPQVITVILQVHMHCEACAQEIKRRILKMKGVENVEPDLKSSQVTVKGVFDPPDLVDYIHRRTGKHAAIVKQEPEKKDEEKGKEEKKADEGGDKKAEEAAKEKKEGGGDAVVAAAAAATAAVATEGGEEVVDVVELRKNEFYYIYPQHYQIHNPHPQRFELPPYDPQMFSDENPNACAVM